MVWAWVHGLSYALETRTDLWSLHHALVIVCFWNTNEIPTAPQENPPSHTSHVGFIPGRNIHRAQTTCVKAGLLYSTLGLLFPRRLLHWRSWASSGAVNSERHGVDSASRAKENGNSRDPATPQDTDRGDLYLRNGPGGRNFWSGDVSLT